MPLRPRSIQKLIPRPADREERDDFVFAGLHLLVAGLYAASGAETALGERRGEYNDPDTLRWGPLAAAPVAALAHVARALAPRRSTRIASQIVNGIAVAVGAAGLASSVVSALTADDRGLFGRRRRTIRERIPSLAPLAFGATGMLGAILDREEGLQAALRTRLERRARVVERLTPKRKTRVDRIVVHV